MSDYRGWLIRFSLQRDDDRMRALFERDFVNRGDMFGMMTRQEAGGVFYYRARRA